MFKRKKYSRTRICVVVLSDRHHFRFPRMAHCFQKMYCLFVSVLFAVLTIINLTRQKQLPCGPMELYTKVWFCARYFALLAYQPFQVLQVYAN